MNNNKIQQQLHAIFGVFMVVFYLGGGIFFLFFADRFLTANNALFGIVGATFLLYGLYRFYVSYKQIVTAFFTKDKDED